MGFLFIVMEVVNFFVEIFVDGVVVDVMWWCEVEWYVCEVCSVVEVMGDWVEVVWSDVLFVVIVDVWGEKYEVEVWRVVLCCFYVVMGYCFVVV